MKRFQLFLFLLAFAGFANATTYLVQPGGTGAAWSGVSGTVVDLTVAGKSLNAWYTATTFQTGDAVWIINGTYTLTGTLSCKSGVTIYGGFAGTEQTVASRAKGANAWNFTNATVLDGASAYSVISNTSGVTIDGLTIQNGVAASGSGGAGLIKNASSILQNCIIHNCTSSVSNYCGGIYVTGSGQLLNSYVYNNTNTATTSGTGGGVQINGVGTVSGCLIDSNTATGGGSGIYINGNPGGTVVTNCTISNNSTSTTGAGGGINVYSTSFTGTLTISNNTISTNTTTNNGGGLYIDVLPTTGTTGTVSIANCTLSGNKSTIAVASGKGGGGIYINEGIFAINNCSILNNTSVSYGAGLLFNNKNASSTLTVSDSFFQGNNSAANNGSAIYSLLSMTANNCVVSGNTGATAVYITAGKSGLFQNCTFASNITSSSAATNISLGTATTSSTFTNCLFYNSTSNPVNASTGTAPTVTYCGFDVALPSYATTGCITGITAASFTNASTGNWSLAAGSPAIDAGTTIPACSPDIVGIPRPQLTAYDMGAYEYPAPSVIQSAVTDKIDTIANPGITDYRIMRVNVNVSGINNQLILSQLNLNIDSTTALSDISKITVYYTGNSNTFTTATPFASVTPSGTAQTIQSLSGTQSLLVGNNYFWVAFNVANSAATGDLLYSKCSSLKLTNSSTYTPTISSYVRSRIVSPSIITSNIDSIINVNVSNHPVMGIKVNIAYSSTPSAISQLVLNLDSTTLLSDISKISIYYTGSSSQFATTTPFASIIPSGTVQTLQTLSGSQTLSSGDNYFWVTYDIPSTAVSNDFLYAKLASASYSNGSCSISAASNVKIHITTPVALTNMIDSIAYPNLSGYAIMRMDVKIFNTSNSTPTVSQINLRMDSTTVLTDISKIKIYYTGSNNLFRNYNQFAAITPGGTTQSTQILTGSQTLSTGDNYFWIAYDIGNANQGNFIYAGCPLVIFADSTSSIPTVLSSARARITTPKKYYLSNINGNDANTGNSPNNAWQSLGKINNYQFLPGDSIFFQCNSIWYGSFNANGSGALGKPIIVDQYGSGTKPLIRASGKVSQAILLQNVEYWELNNLYVSNWDSTVTYQTTSGGPLGINIVSYNFNGTMHHIKLKNMLVRDINGNNTKGSNEGTGIYWNCGGSTQSNIDSLTIENCEVRNVNRNGIRGVGSFGLRTSNWFPNTHLIIRDCVLDSIGGDGIVVKQFNGALVEHNTLFRCRWGGIGSDNSAALWTHSSDNAVIQYNEVAYTKNTNGTASDGMALDIDGNCQNVTMQYNYSHDNDGGFLLVISDVVNSESIMTQNHTVRYNISVNDGIQKHRLIYLPSVANNVQIYNNSCFNNSGDSIEVMNLNNWNGYPTNVFYNNNIFSFIGTAKGTITNTSAILAAACTFNNNIFYGNYSHLSRITNNNGITANPMYVNNNAFISSNNSYIYGYKLKSTSPALNAGMLISNNGGLDYWGNVVSTSLVPNIGAWNGQYFKTTITFNTGGKVDNYTSGDVATLPNDTVHPFTITPNAGYAVSAVKYNGTDVTSQLVSGVYTAPALTADGTLTVNFVSDTVVVNGVKNISDFTLTPASVIIVSTGAILSLDQSVNATSLTINAGGEVTNTAGNMLSVTTLSINSDATNGTGTFVDANTSGGLTVSGTTNVNQYLTSGRNWYISSPVSKATSSVVSANTSNPLYSYAEPTGLWTSITNDTTSLGVMTGYVANIASSRTVTFTGGTLNTGAKSIGLTFTSGAAKQGFNLVGNPYPSYLDCTAALASINTANMEPTIWYRTQNTSNAYVFDTYNTTSNLGTGNNEVAEVTQYVAPMQAFWVRVASGNTSGTFAVDNTMRSHQSQSVSSGNRLKAVAHYDVASARPQPTEGKLLTSSGSSTTTQSVLRLKVSNGVNSDEAIVLFNPNASNGYDSYDSPKMSNNNAAIPEIYTLAGGQQVVINGLNSIDTVNALPLGFTTGTSNTFTIMANEVSNFDPGIRIILNDNLQHTSTELTDSAAYTFTSDVVSTTSRFSISFKTLTEVASGINTTTSPAISIFRSGNDQITVAHSSGNGQEGEISIYSALGQKVLVTPTTGESTVINAPFSPGIYIVSVRIEGKLTTKKLVID